LASSAQAAFWHEKIPKKLTRATANDRIDPSSLDFGACLSYHTLIARPKIGCCVVAHFGNVIPDKAVPAADVAEDEIPLLLKKA
jgi:hypothetical protein